MKAKEDVLSAGYIFAVLFSIFLCFACVSKLEKNKQLQTFKVIEATEFLVNWQQVCKGINLAKIEYPEYPLITWAVKVDLTTPDLSVLTTEAELFRDKRVIAESTRHFAIRNKADIAVNAAFFKYKSLLFDIYFEPLGIHINQSKILSEPIYKLAALFFLQNNTAVITDTQLPELIPNNPIYAISGFSQILKKGMTIHTPIIAEDSRTAAGTDKSGKTLFIFFAEGEKKHKSRGLTFDQTAFFMEKLGAYDALQLDGGGSSSLVIKKNEQFIQIVPSIVPQIRRNATNFGFKISKSYNFTVCSNLYAAG